jgi:ribosomal protein S18 acetylase RimI-like enzyme
VKTQSIRFRGGVARVAAWHGRPEIASVALLCRGAPSIEAIEHLLEQLRAVGYREVITNALAPGASLPLVDCGFEIRGRLHLLSHDFESLPGPTRRTRRSGGGDRREVLAVDAAAFEDFWQLDDIGLRQAARATPRSHLRVTKGDPIRGYGLFGRAERTGYVQRLAIHPSAQGEGFGSALLTDGLHWMRVRGARSAFVNTQVENERALGLYERAGFRRLPVGLCVLGIAL